MDYTVTDILANADTVSTKRGIKRYINNFRDFMKERNYPYRFFVDGNNVFVQRVLNKGYTGMKKSKPVRAVSGLICVERIDGRRGMFKVTLRKNKLGAYALEMPEEMMESSDIFNSFIMDNMPGKYADSPVLLLEWFDNRPILPNLLMLSYKTAEVLPTKEVLNADQSKLGSDPGGDDKLQAYHEGERQEIRIPGRETAPGEDICLWGSDSIGIP